MTEQTTGNEAREMVAYRHRYCGGRIHLERREDESTVGLAAICSSCGDTDGLDLEAVEVIPAPSIGEPQVEAVARRLADTCSLDFATACNLLRPPHGALAVLGSIGEGREPEPALIEAMKSLRVFADGLSRNLSDAAYRGKKEPRHDERMATDCAFLIGALNRVEEALDFTSTTPREDGEQLRNALDKEGDD